MIFFQNWVCDTRRQCSDAIRAHARTLNPLDVHAVTRLSQ